ncbi:MAG TPA: 2Fe-2S iron-sulfur cluster-binding protein, partial [Burkholderiaceae bacterium]|nr:2Fe-2S iron-sulfur cluster-binding protein [Burkholderiaceae bacterium]
MATATSFVLNGERVVVDIEPATPLLWALRDQLRLTGTKFGCGIGACGACTVVVDGRAQRSCVTPLESVGGRAVTTIEGLGANQLHAL